MKKNIRYIILFLIATSIITAFSFFKTSPDFSTIKKVMNIVEKEYYKKLTQEELLEHSLDGMLRSLDPNSAYLNQDSLKEMQIITTGEFAGIGVEILPENGGLKVVSPYQDSPAFAAGIKEDDYIMEIDRVMVKKMKSNEAVLKIRGKPGSKVHLTVFRPQTSETKEFDVTRKVIKIEPIKAYVIDGGIIYISINTFIDGVAETIEKYLSQVIPQLVPARGIILDVRWNPGGLLDQAYKVSDLFLDSGDIVSVKGRDSKNDKLFSASGPDIAEGLPMVVLINGGSASAAEIVAAALHDNDRATLIGTKSFGKGSVQTVIPVDNTAIKLTTALYYTPKGVSIEETRGVEPDITIALSKDIPKENTFGTLIFKSSALAQHYKNKFKKMDKEKILHIKSKNIMDSQLHKAIEKIYSMQGKKKTKKA